MTRRPVAALMLFAVLLGAACADPRCEPGPEAAAPASRAISDRITGAETDVWPVRVAPGQGLHVVLTPTSRDTFFDVLAPDGTALHVGSQAAASWNEFGLQPAEQAGTYEVRVYQTGAARAAGETNGYELSIEVFDTHG